MPDGLNEMDELLWGISSSTPGAVVLAQFQREVAGRRPIAPSPTFPHAPTAELSRAAKYVLNAPLKLTVSLSTERV